MSIQYGMKRVLEPKYVLPTSAWKLDNSRNLYPDELRVAIKRVHLEGTSFKQICTELNNNEEKIKQAIIDIVIRRGKLHNPVTDTGGLVYGEVEAIGSEYDNQHGLKPGDKVICNASLASVPMHIENIRSIDYVFNQIEVEGYAIVHSKIPLIKLRPGLPLNLLLFVLDESGTLYKLSNLVDGKEKILIVGNNMLTNLLFGYVTRRELGEKVEIVCLLDRKTGIQVSGGGIDRLISKVFNEMHYLDILKPVECVEKMNAESMFDLSVNCAEIPGAETVNALVTKPGGTVLFANFINNMNIALYITESISKSLNVHGAVGYMESYDEFDMAIVEEIAEYFENASIAQIRKNNTEDEMANPYSRSLLENTMTEDFVFNSKAMRLVLDEILKVSKYDCNVIIYGETGVGKEKVANLIQKNSDRKKNQLRCNLSEPDRI